MNMPGLDVGPLFETVQALDSALTAQLAHPGQATFLLVGAAGLLTSVSPCTLSVLPLTIGYIGGYGDQAGGTSLLARSAAFATGLAASLALLGLVSGLVGVAYGQAAGSVAPILVSIVAMAMGLNLLGVLSFRFPTLDWDVRDLGLPPLVQAFLAGATFALAASPCSTPILASLLAYVSTTKQAGMGAALLFTYTLGYVAPLLAAAVLTGGATKVLSVRRYSAWIPTASGLLLVTGGGYTLLSRLFP